MRTRSPFALLVLAAASPLWLAAQTAEPAEPPPIVGQVDGNVYVSPTGLFRVTIPVLPELGGNITDTPNVVTFEDSFTTHITIAVFPMDATQRWELSTRGKKDYLVQFFTNALLADFRQKFPGAAVESAKFLPNLQDGSLLAYVLLPGGSMFLQRIALFGEGDKIPTAKRGNLLFVRDEFVYVLSTEMTERTTERSLYTKTTAEEDDILRQRLLDVYSRIKFAAPAAPAAAKP